MLWENLEESSARLGAEPQLKINCAPLCTSCCMVDLEVFSLEAFLVKQACNNLTSKQLSQIKASIKAQRHCVFLQDGLCLVYSSRPLICRTQGLPLWLEDSSVSLCDQNHAPSPVPGSLCLDLNRINTLLAVLQRAWESVGGEAVRIPLSSVLGVDEREEE